MDVTGFYVSESNMIIWLTQSTYELYDRESITLLNEPLSQYDFYFKTSPISFMSPTGTEFDEVGAVWIRDTYFSYISQYYGPTDPSRS